MKSNTWAASCLGVAFFAGFCVLLARHARQSSKERTDGASTELAQQDAAPGTLGHATQEGNKASLRPNEPLTQTTPNYPSTHSGAAGAGHLTADEDATPPSPHATANPPGIANEMDRPGQSAFPFGAVKVLGARGCTRNTQGWFLSVGTPEDYDFSVSENGETLEVTPNREPPRGQFELVHCVEDANTAVLMGKHVRLIASIKAEGVTEISKARLRGEDVHYEPNLYKSVDAIGTFDWKDFAVDAEIGPEVAHLSFGFTFRSRGMLWIKHPVFGPTD